MEHSLKINHTDEQNLQAMIGESEIPLNLLKEVEAMTILFHRARGSGPIGPAALACCARMAGIMPPAPPTNDAMDWRRAPVDGSCLVEGLWNGKWKKGVYCGFVDSGTLSIRFDDDERCRELRKKDVRIYDPPIEWKGMLKGTNLHVNMDGRYLKASYVKKYGDSVTVKVGGKEQKVSADACRMAG